MKQNCVVISDTAEDLKACKKDNAGEASSIKDELKGELATALTFCDDWGDLCAKCEVL